MVQETIRERVRHFLEPHFGDHELGDSEEMFALGYVNSLFAIQLVAFVRREFAITVGSTELDMDNFRSVDALVTFIGAKLAAVR
jgi:methoxymalonate biosynthesis acyl carrier protein